MKKIVATFLFMLLLAFEGYSQKKYIIGVDALTINSLTKNISKQALFNNDLGLQLGFRINIDNFNYLNIHAGGTKCI